MIQAAFCSLIAVLLCLPAGAQWQRVVFTGKGETKDVPSPHSLSYFTANPFLRDDGDEFCRICTPEGKAISDNGYSIRGAVKPVAVVAGYPILDVLYYVSTPDTQNNTQVSWKSILVQVGPDLYREIFHLQTSGPAPSIQPSRIVQSGNEPVLMTMDRDGGNGGGCWEGYWWFDRSGPHSLDFSRLQTAIKDRLPENARFNGSCSNLDLSAQQVKSAVQKSDARCHACDWVGEVTAAFRLDGPTVEPVSVNFKPDVPQ